jgi:ankyrin repeat protein
VVALLISTGADVGARDESGRSALHFAELHGHSSVIELLRFHGATD